MKTDIKIEKPELNEIWRINVCSMARYNETKGTVTVEFTDRIMPYLAQIKEKFVLYNLKEVANFGSLYTTRLYELIQDFKETGWMIKSVDELREIFAVGNKYRLYGHFKNKTFNHACEEINNNFNMNLKFEEIKEGRKVVAIRFSFNPVKGENPSIIHDPNNLNTDRKPNIKAKILKSNEPGQLEFNKALTENLKGSFSSKEPRNIKNILSSLFSKFKPF